MAESAPEPHPELGAAIAALRELILAGERYRLAAATYLGLTVTESQAISYLFSRGSLGQNDLAQALGMGTGSITTLVDRLQARGFVERQRHPTDRRRQIIRIPDEMLETLAEVRTWMQDAFVGLADGELSALTTALEKIAAGLDGRARTVISRHADGPRTARRRR